MLLRDHYSWVESDRSSDHSARSDSTQLTSSQNVQNWEKLANQYSRVESDRRSDHSARFDSTQPVELSWVESDRALWSGLKTHRRCVLCVYKSALDSYIGLCCNRRRSRGNHLTLGKCAETTVYRYRAVFICSFFPSLPLLPDVTGTYGITGIVWYIVFDVPGHGLRQRQ